MVHCLSDLLHDAQMVPGVHLPLLDTTEPSWIATIVIGAVLGALINQFGSVILYPFRRLRKDEFIGTWYEYYWTWCNGTEQVWTGRVSIKRGVLRPYVVRIWEKQPEETDSGDVVASPAVVHRYRGGLRLEGGHVIIDVEATTHTESAVHRYPRWIPSSSDRVVGIWMAFDHSGTPTSGAVLLTRDKQDVARAEELLTQRVSTSPGLLRVRD